jgi:hypothetical protein
MKENNTAINKGEKTRLIKQALLLVLVKRAWHRWKEGISIVEV